MPPTPVGPARRAQARYAGQLLSAIGFVVCGDPNVLQRLPGQRGRSVLEGRQRSLLEETCVQPCTEAARMS